MPVIVCWYATNRECCGSKPDQNQTLTCGVVAGHRRRAVGTGWQVGFGNSECFSLVLERHKLTLPLVGGIIASYSFLAKDAPEYKMGYSICLSFICLSMVSCIAYFLHMSWENRRRDRAQDESAKLSIEEKQEMGDLNPDYRYLL